MGRLHTETFIDKYSKLFKYINNIEKPVSIKQLSRDIQVSPSTLKEMLDFIDFIKRDVDVQQVSNIITTNSIKNNNQWRLVFK